MEFQVYLVTISKEDLHIYFMYLILWNYEKVYVKYF